MKKVILPAIVTLGAALLFGSAAQPQPEAPKPLRDFMRLKLEHSQKVLEGLVTDDHTLVSKHSQEMSLLSQEAAWAVLQTPEYFEHSAEFRRIANDLTEAARQKNLDGASFKYVELTMKCITCHKYVRGVRLARAGA